MNQRFCLVLYAIKTAYHFEGEGGGEPEYRMILNRDGKSW